MLASSNNKRHHYRLVISSDQRASGTPADFRIVLPEVQPAGRECWVTVSDVSVDAHFNDTSANTTTDIKRLNAYPAFVLDSSVYPTNGYDTRYQGAPRTIARVAKAGVHTGLWGAPFASKPTQLSRDITVVGMPTAVFQHGLVLSTASDGASKPKPFLTFNPLGTTARFTLKERLVPKDTSGRNTTDTDWTTCRSFDGTVADGMFIDRIVVTLDLEWLSIGNYR